MKCRFILLGAALAFAGAVHADFDPIELTPGSFNADVIVERTAPRPFPSYVTATMDGGTNNNAWVWYERGFDVTRPTTGIPPAGSTFTALNDANRSYTMAPSYAANNVLCVYSALPAGTLTLTTPAAFSRLSVLNAGGGASTIDYTIRYQGGGTQTGTLTVNDWHNQTPTEVAAISNGRVNTDNGQLGNTYGNVPRLFYGDIVLTDTVNPVTSIDFSSSSGSRAAIFGLSGSTDGVTFNPVAVTGFNRDMVIEAGIVPTGCLFTKTTVTMDSGSTNNTGNTFYEIGFNTGAPTTGLPPAGSSITNGGRAFTFAPNYVGASNIFYVGNFEGYSTATITLATPAAYQALSFLNCAGNGPVLMDVTIHHADASAQGTSLTSLDWFNQPDPFYVLNGRFEPNNLNLNNVNSGNPRLYTNDIVLANVSSPVTRVDLTFVTGGRAAILALAGQVPGGDAFYPVTVTGYNADAVVEASAQRFPDALTTATTASMDGGTNNTGNTWYEQGYYSAMPNSGLPAPGTVITSLNQPDHHYKMPATYTGPNAVFVDSVHAVANLTPLTPAPYSALSFLSATANNNVTNEVIMQYADGTSETNTFTSRDWFNNAPYAFTAWGRVNLNTRTINNDAGHNANLNPRLYEAQFALGNTVSPVTNIILTFVGAVNPTTGRMVVLAVSATAGDFSPILTTITPATAGRYEGQNLTLACGVTGGTEPITYRWQFRPPGSTTFNDLADGGNISGAATTNLAFTGIARANAGDYRMVATNSAGFGISALASVTVVSGLQDVTVSFDTIYTLNGTTPGNEGVEHAIDNVIQKYLNYDAIDTAAPFVGPVGFVVTPSMGATLVTALRIYTANDVVDRDPADFLLEGSNDYGTTWVPIASGPLALPAARNTVVADIVDPLVHANQEVHFANTKGYTSYRVTFQNVKNNAAANSMQLAEIELLGILAPPGLEIAVGTGGSLTLTVSEPGTLLSTTNLTAPVIWTEEGPISGSTTITPAAGVPAKYYRLRVP